MWFWREAGYSSQTHFSKFRSLRKPQKHRTFGRSVCQKTPQIPENLSVKKLPKFPKRWYNKKKERLRDGRRDVVMTDVEALVPKEHLCGA